MDRVWMEVWALRLIWLTAPLVFGPNLEPALDSVEPTPRLIIEIALWTAWFVGLIATLVPHPISLTTTRILAPALVGISVVAGFGHQWSWGLASAAGYGVLVTLLTLLPSVGDAMVNGSAYGSERRMALRPPAVAFVGPIPVAWILAFIGLSGWAMLLAAGRQVLAALAAVVGTVVVWAAGRLLHQLARRWIVFVPAGFVIHDHFQLAEPVLLPRSKVLRLGPAAAEGPAVGNPPNDDAPDNGGDNPARLDLSSGSLGLALEVETSEPMSFGVRSGGQIHITNASKVVFSPTLPGALLSEARVRGIKIGGSPGVG